MATPFNPLSDKLEAYQRQRAIADQLLKQGTTPLQSTTSGTGNHPIVVAPGKLEVFAKLAQALGGAYAQNNADSKYQDIAKEMQQGQQDSIRELSAPARSQDQGLDTGRFVESANNALKYGVDPSVVSALVKKNLKEPEAYTLGQGQQRFDENNKPVATVAPKQEAFTLSPGQQRFGEGNQPIASVPAKAVEGNVNPSDFDPKSIDKFKTSGNYGDLVRTYAPTAATQGNASISDQAIKFAADTYRSTGKFPTTMGRNPALQARVLNMVAADSAASGDSVGAINARQGALKANNQALDQVTKLESATTAYYNTLDKNLTNLQEISGKVDSSGVPLINKVYRAYQQNVSGDPEVAKYVTYLRAASSEFAKIQSGSLGNAPASDAARRDADEVLSKYLTKGQLDAVVQAMRGEGRNRLQSISEQKKSLLTDLGQGVPTQGGPSAAPPSQPAAKPPSGPPKGYKLMQDAQGNKAYVGPNGEIQEVP